MNKEKNVKKAFLWNMIGSTSYSVSSFLYLMVVTRICGAEVAGFFSLCYATAQLLLTLGRYGMRTFQTTDLQQKYSFKEYGISRVITCAVMLLFGMVYGGVSFSGEYIPVCIFIIAMKMVDAVEDVYHGNFQQKYHVELMGKLLAARNIYSAVAFTVTLYCWRDLYVTCIFTAVTSLAGCLVINQYATGKYLSGMEREQRGLQISSVVQLLKTCTPIFAVTFLSLLLYNVPKYAMSGVLSDEYQTYYSVLFMPSFVITLMAEFVFKPTITTIAELWWKDDIKGFTSYVLRIVGIILLICAGIVVGGHLLGRTLLGLIYGVNLSPYKLHFIILLIGGGVSAEVYMIYNILIAIRKSRCIIVVYLIAAVLTIMPAGLMVKNFQVMGACMNYLYSCSCLFLMLAGVLVGVILKKAGKMQRGKK